MKLADIQIRDPYVLPVRETGEYWLFGTTDKNLWAGPGTGFDTYRSRDLQDWEGPFPAFRPELGFWGTTNFWAPEVHAFRGRYYMFATFKATERYRGTQVLAASAPQGPYRPWSDGPVTPKNWECLDGTLHVEPDGTPWIVFCQEWVQVHNGGMWAQPLSPDLKQATGRPVFLFSASEAPWGKSHDWVIQPDTGNKFPHYVTDGPFLHRTRTGALLMLWSSYGPFGYAMGVARSESGRIDGPWIQVADPLWHKDGGHGMIFRTFEGQLMLTLHQPNDTPNERPFFFPICEAGDTLCAGTAVTKELI